MKPGEPIRVVRTYPADGGDVVEWSDGRWYFWPPSESDDDPFRWATDRELTEAEARELIR